MSDILQKMAYDLKKYYAAGFLVGIIVLYVVLARNSFSLDALLNTEIALFLTAISGVIMKFMGGLGITLTYATIASFVFRFFSNKMRKDEVLANKVKTLVILPIVGIAIYGFYKFFTALFFANRFGFLEILVSLFGFWSLVYFVYLGPAFIGKYEPRFDGPGIIDSVRSRLSDARHSIWKGYQLRVHGEFGEVYADEFENYQNDIEEVRVKLSGLLLFPMCVILLLVPPFAGIGFILWLRTFSLHHRALTRLERGLLVVIVMVTVLVSTYLFLFDTFTFVLYLDLSYAFGIFSSILLLLWIVYQS